MVTMVRIRKHMRERQNKKDSTALNTGFVIEANKLIKTLDVGKIVYCFVNRRIEVLAQR